MMFINWAVKLKCEMSLITKRKVESEGSHTLNDLTDLILNV